MNGNNTKNPKSATTAGVLAIVLGVFGAHNWYLNDRKKAKAHVALAIVAASTYLLNIILRLLISSVSSSALAQFMSSLATILKLLAWFALLIDIIWAIIEGILLLLQGDEGLAEKGYKILPKPTDEQTPSSESQATAATNPQISMVTEPPASAVTYHSSNIQQQNDPQLLGQTLSTQNVETPALTVQNSEGKSAINPVILRRALIVAAVIVGTTIAFFLVKASIDSAFAVSYGDAYRVAKEIMPNFTTAAKSSSCQYAVDYVKAVYVDKPTYNGYVEVCRGLATSDSELVTKLGETGAMRWDSEIAAQYKDFKEQYDAVFANQEKTEQMVKALDLYQIWHNYVLAIDRLTVNSAETDFQQAADILRQSGNEILAKYGDEWYYRELDYINTYKAYWDLSYTDPNKESAKLEAEAKRDSLKDWVEEHRPDVLTLAPFEVPNLTPAYDSFTKLYGLIRTGYEKHYDHKSGDCQTAGKKVYCS